MGANERATSDGELFFSNGSEGSSTSTRKIQRKRRQPGPNHQPKKALNKKRKTFYNA